MRQIAGNDYPIVAVIEKRIYGAINQSLFVEWRCEAGVEICVSSVRTMALGAVGIDVRANASFQREGRVRNGTGLRICRQPGFAVICAEHTQMAESAQLIVGDAGLRIDLHAIELMCSYTEHITRIGIMAGKAILAAWEDPGLSARGAICVGDGVILVCAGEEQVGIGIVVTPFVSQTINAT